MELCPLKVASLCRLFRSAVRCFSLLLYPWALRCVRVMLIDFFADSQTMHPTRESPKSTSRLMKLWVPSSSSTFDSTSTYVAMTLGARSQDTIYKLLQVVPYMVSEMAHNGLTLTRSFPPSRKFCHCIRRQVQHSGLVYLSTMKPQIPKPKVSKSICCPDHVRTTSNYTYELCPTAGQIQNEDYH